MKRTNAAKSTKKKLVLSGADIERLTRVADSELSNVYGGAGNLPTPHDKLD